MKNHLLLAVLTLLFVQFSSIDSKASHFMGGDIYVSHLGGMDYSVQLNIYRDSVGIPIPGGQILEIYDHMTSTLINVGMYNALLDTSYGIGFRTEKGIYLDTIQLPANGDYEIGWNSCCRNAAIANISNPSGHSFYISTRINTGLTGGNSSPIFLNDPVVTALNGTAWNYNPLPFDADGDSLVYSLRVPTSDMGVQVTGFSSPSGTFPFVVDQLTGAITWTPNMLGYFQSSILIEEYRNGVKIGHAMRDMQVIVFPPFTGNGGPSFTNTGGWSKNANNNFQFNVPAESNFQLTIGVTDPDNDRVALSAVGEPFGLSQDPATFYLKAGLPDYEQEGILFWTPHLSHIREDLYPVVFRKTEFVNGISFSDDMTVMFQVNSFVNTTKPGAEFQLQAYPNPATSEIQLGFYLNASGTMDISIFNNLGQRLLSTSKDLVSGAQILPINISDLSTGNYYVRISQNGISSSIPINIK